jgi:serine/threonine protein kinase
MNVSDIRTLGTYRIVQELEPVAGGRLFRAADDASGIAVQIKLLTSEPDEGALHQAHKLSRLGSGGIPLLYEIGDHEGQIFLVSAEAEGQSLGPFVQGGGRVDREILIDWLRQALILLAEAHADGVIHGSLAVDAIRVGREGQLQLTGFGLTQAHGDTPELQSPEQRAGLPPTAASDLYSLGALFRRLAAPRELGGASDRALEATDPLRIVLSRATAEDPRRRFQDAADMERALRALDEKFPVSGVPATPEKASVSRSPGVAGTPEETSELAFQTMAMNSAALRDLLQKPPPSSPQAEAEPTESEAAEARAPFPASARPKQPETYDLEIRPRDARQPVADPDLSPPAPLFDQSKGKGGRWAALGLILTLIGTGAALLATRGFEGLRSLAFPSEAPTAALPPSTAVLPQPPLEAPAPPTLETIQLLIDQGEEVEAIRQLNLLLESPSLVDPVPALEILGTLLLQRGETTKARRALESAAAVQPSGGLLYKLGLALITEGDPEEAALRLREALALEPESREIKDALYRLESEP